MKPLVVTSAIREAVRNCLWWKTPEDAISNPAELAAYILTYGRVNDCDALLQQWNGEDTRRFRDRRPLEYRKYGLLKAEMQKTKRRLS